MGENPEDELNKEMDVQTKYYYDDYNILPEPTNEKIVKRRR